MRSVGPDQRLAYYPLLLLRRNLELPTDHVVGLDRIAAAGARQSHDGLPLARLLGGPVEVPLAAELYSRWQPSGLERGRRQDLRLRAKLPRASMQLIPDDSVDGAIVRPRK